MMWSFFELINKNTEIYISVQEIFPIFGEIYFLMAQKTKEKKSIGDDIKTHFTNQAWLAAQIGMSEAQLSRKMKGTRDWTQEDLDKINKVLNTNYKLINAI